MRYYIIAGEASGDLHGSNLIKELKQLDAQTSMRCWGGDMMQAQGAELVKHYRELAFMGFYEVIKNLGTIVSNIKFCKQDILAYKPDVLILVDYPGFNLRIAKWAKQQGFKIIYYISPQVWAWKENRVKSIKKCVDKMLCILPFEKEFYAKWNYPVEYVGHPLVKVIDDFKSVATKTKLSDKPIIALLPGSRKQEILIKLPIMLEVAKQFPDYVFFVAKAPGQEDSFYSDIIVNSSSNIQSTSDTYALLDQATAACVTSGTATLETALFGVPEVICYKGSSFSYQIAKRLVKIKFICLVNLIMDKEVVKELIQHEMTIANIATELKGLLQNDTRKAVLQKEYADLKTLLSQGGNANANAAKSIYDFVTSVKKSEQP
jgi:lipid-A-disaccharide synthase